MKVSIIIPFHNVTKFLPAALDSLVEQTMQDFEVIVADDGSTEAYDDFGASYSDRLKIRLAKLPRRGVSATRNSVAQEAAGTFLAFLDADDYWKPSKLEVQLQRMDEVVLCYGNAEYVDESGRSLGKTHHQHLGVDLLPDGDVTNVIPHMSFLLPSTMMIRRRDYLEIGGFDEELAIAEDWEFASRAAQKGMFAAIQDPLVLYRRHSASTGTISNRGVRDKRVVIDRVTASLPKRERSASRRIHLANAYLHEMGTSVKRRLWIRAIAHCLRAATISLPAVIRTFGNYFFRKPT